jgi:hypothetical protein
MSNKTIIKTTNRYGNKWTINETLQLQREFELLGLNVGEIASIHKRSVDAILYRLEMEGFTNNLTSALRSINNNTNDNRKMQLRSRIKKST